MLINRIPRVRTLLDGGNQLLVSSEMNGTTDLFGRLTFYDLQKKPVSLSFQIRSDFSVLDYPDIRVKS